MLRICHYFCATVNDKLFKEKNIRTSHWKGHQTFPLAVHCELVCAASWEYLRFAYSEVTARLKSTASDLVGNPRGITHLMQYSLNNESKIVLNRNEKREMTKTTHTRLP